LASCAIAATAAPIAFSVGGDGRTYAGGSVVLTLAHALSSNTNRIVQQRAVMIISNRVSKARHAASGHMRIAVKKHESKASPGGRTERRSYACFGARCSAGTKSLSHFSAIRSRGPCDLNRDVSAARRPTLTRRWRTRSVNSRPASKAAFCPACIQAWLECIQRLSWKQARGGLLRIRLYCGCSRRPA
jgi:hypothetical protein